jgi:hypothetical protein
LPNYNCESRHANLAHLVLQSTVFTLCVFSNDGKVDVLVSGWVARQGLADDQGGVDVQLLPHGNVPTVVRSSVNGCKENTYVGSKRRQKRGGIYNRAANKIGRSPFRPTLFLLKLSIASLNSDSLPCVSPETLNCSHSTGTLSDSKTSLTLSAISVPIPSPGIKVTV